ncbi:MAG: hypothetical protein M3077_15015, partial [Candidatus Dormibacteraeota bacterium]|nr:hypothetical protein [Candidatus Dormibacteraeota bacterium]
MEDLLQSVQALAYLAVLATDAPLPIALTRLQDQTASGIRDRTLLTDELRLLQVYVATVGGWNWWPNNEALAPVLAALAPRLRGVAEDLMKAPAAATWWQPLDRSQQIWIHGPDSNPVERSLQAAQRPLHPWASKPRGGFWTSTALPGL